MTIKETLYYLFQRLTTSEITPSITKTSTNGINISGQRVYQTGNVVQLKFVLSADNVTVAAAGNIFRGTFNDTELIPPGGMGLTSFLGNKTLLGYLAPNGQIVIMNTSALDVKVTSSGFTVFGTGVLSGGGYNPTRFIAFSIREGVLAA